MALKAFAAAICFPAFFPLLVNCGNTSSFFGLCPRLRAVISRPLTKYHDDSRYLALGNAHSLACLFASYLQIPILISQDCFPTSMLSASHVLLDLFSQHIFFFFSPLALHASLGPLPSFSSGSWFRSFLFSVEVLWFFSRQCFLLVSRSAARPLLFPILTGTCKR